VVQIRGKRRAAQRAHPVDAWASRAGAEPEDGPHGRRSSAAGFPAEPLCWPNL